MAFSESSPFRSRRVYRSISSALASAVLEWMLIFMLFVDAILSFLITKFASTCELQTPCLLCSRLDHILGNRRLKYYWDLICRSHKLEISSLVLCHAHNKLVDVQGMCENCLFSFATFNKSNAETYRLLVGKLGENSGFGVDPDPSNEDHIPSTKNCSCCNEPWIPRWSGQVLVKTRSVASEAADSDVNLSDSFGDNFDNTRKKNEAVSVDASLEKSSRLDPLSHVQYSELNIDSDVESEIMLRYDDHVHAPIHEFFPKEDEAIESINPKPFIVHQPDDLLPKKILEPVSVSQQSYIVSNLQADVTESHSSADIASKVDIVHGLEELNWEKVECKVEPSVFPELISLNEVPPSSILKDTMAGEESTFLSVNEVPPSSAAAGFLLEVSREKNLTSQDGVSQLHDNGEKHADASKEFPITLNSIPSSISSLETVVQDLDESKPIFPNDSLPTESEENPVAKSEEHNLVDKPPSMNAGEIPTEELKQISTHEINCETPVTDGDQTSKADSKPATSEIASETIQVSIDSAQQALNLLDLSDAYRLAVGNRGRQLSGVLAEQWMGKDSSRLSEDLRQLLSQLSASRENPSREMSPRVPVSPKISLNSDELKNSDACLQILQKRISLERNESNISLDGSLVSEIEGESVADRLKRQVEHDKKLLSALYKELEEERSASSIAANQSMAMITRLQEEKAALHMEALQCLRMMEEQAEYDMEALQKTSDLLTEREKEIQDLEAELEYYRTKFPDELMLDDNSNYVADLKATDAGMNHSEVHSDTFARVDDETGTNKSSLLEFEDESSYILQKLQKLEKKLCMFSNDVPCSDIGNGEYSTDERDGINEFQELNNKPNSSTDENEVENDHDPSLVKSDTIAMENTGINPDCRQSTQVSAIEMDLNSLVNEVRNLNKRLQALEADRNFLEHSINSIRSGEKGVQFIQDIASQLKEIRKIGIMRTQQSIH